MNLIVGGGVIIMLVLIVLSAVTVPNPDEPFRAECKRETEALRAEKNQALGDAVVRVVVSQIEGAAVGAAVGKSAKNGAAVGSAAAGVVAALDDPEGLAKKSQALGRAMQECMARKKP